MRKKTIKLLNCFIVVMFLSACAPAKTEIETKEPDDGVFFDQPQPSLEAEPREAVYLYEKETQSQVQKIVLTLNSEPLPLAKSYVRLVGVVCGVSKVALLEVGGRGCILGQGNNICGYKVRNIFIDKVILEKE